MRVVCYPSLVCGLDTYHVKGRETARRLRVLAILAESQVWFSMPTSGGSQLSITPAPEALKPSSDFHGIQSICTYTHAHTHVSHANAHRHK